MKAVIDVGSNSVLLLVAEKVEGRWHPVLETSVVSALGENTKTTGLLSEAAMAATLAALKAAFEDARATGAQSVVAAVTMAGRIAKNTSTFLDRAKLQGTPVSVLSGEREAELGFLAAAEDEEFSHYETLSVVDVGGHSTELVTAHREGNEWVARFRKSFSVGTLGLRESMSNAETLDAPALLKCSATIDETLGFTYMPQQAGHAVTLGATGTNLVSIRDKMPRWSPEHVHGALLLYEEISRAVGWLCSLSDSKRAALQGIETGRERTIHLGALILERCLHALKVDECSVSVKGWRYGLLNHPELLDV